MCVSERARPRERLKFSPEPVPAGSVGAKREVVTELAKELLYRAKKLSRVRMFQSVRMSKSLYFWVWMRCARRFCWTRPLPKFGLGYAFKYFKATGFSRFAGMTLFGKGSPLRGSIIWIGAGSPERTGSSSSDKSPLRNSAVGTLANSTLRGAVSRSPWQSPKATSLFLMTGPPSVPPNWLRRKGSLLGAKVGFASSAELRRNSNALP